MKTFARLFLLFTLTTTVELILLLTVGKAIGIWATIVIILRWIRTLAPFLI